MVDIVNIPTVSVESSPTANEHSQSLESSVNDQFPITPGADSILILAPKEL